jgi:hypothetical protein
MNKMVLVVLLTLCPMFTFGQNWSVGAGVGWAPYWDTLKESVDSAWVASETSSPAVLEGQVYVDATYFQASVGYIGQGAFYQVKTTDGSGYEDTIIKKNGFSGSWISYSLLLKYPFKAGKTMLFPLLGAEFDQNLTYTDAGGNDFKSALTTSAQDDLNNLWLRAGAGMDVPLGSVVYLRFSVLGNFKLLTQTEKDYVKSLADATGYTVDLKHIRLNTIVSLGMKLGVPAAR